MSTQRIAAMLFGLGLALVSWQAIRVLGRPPSPLGRKLAQAQTVLSYRVGGGLTPGFELARSERKLRIMTSGVVKHAFVPTRSTRWGLRLRLEGNRATLWQRDVYFSARQSKGPVRQGEARDEAVFARDGTQLTDERETFLNLPARTTDGRLVLELAPDSDADEAVVRVFVAEERSPERVELLAKRLTTEERDSLLRAGGGFPSAYYDFGDVAQRMRTRWRRVPAAGDSGLDYQTRLIALTAYAEFGADTTTPPTISRATSAAFNLRGPAMVYVESATSAPLTVSSVPASLSLELPAGRPHRFTPVRLPAGPHTLVIATPSLEPVPLRLWGAPTLQLTAPTPPPPPEGAPPPTTPPSRWDLFELPVELRPDKQAFDAELVDAEHTARVPVYPEAGQGLGALVRVDARLRWETLESVPFAKLELRFLDLHGTRLGQETRLLAGARSSFELARWQGTEVSVSEPISLRVIAPANAATIELTADVPVLVRFARFRGPPTQLAAPWQMLTIPLHKWRYAKLAQRAWAPFLSDELATELVKIVAQVRLEPEGPDEEGRTEAITYATLTPEGSPARHAIRERLAPEHLAATLAAWPPGAWTKLDAQPRQFRFPEGGAAPARLRWRTEAAALGARLAVTVDGRPWHEVTLDLPAGALALPPLPPGPHAVSLQAPNGTVAWLDRPVANPADALALGVEKGRVIYELAPAGLTVRFTAPRVPVTVYAIVYTPEAGGGQSVRVRLDGGTPKRRDGAVVAHYTNADLVRPLPPTKLQASPTFADRPGGGPGYSHVVAIRLGEDLTPGTHRITLTPTWQGPAYARFIVDTPTTTSPDRVLLWKPLPE